MFSDKKQKHIVLAMSTGLIKSTELHLSQCSYTKCPENRGIVFYDYTYV